jgi:hypothetical protein
MKRLLVLTAAALAGCATIVPPHQASNEDVCVNLTIPQYAPTAQQEARRRGLDCGPYLAQRQANSAANMSLGLQLLNQGREPPRRPLNCTSYRAGNTVQTDCH